MKSMRWIHVEGSSGLYAYVSATTDETVASGAPQSDGTVTVTVTGGVGPYTVVNADGYGTQTGAGPTFVFSGLPGAFDYSFIVYDSTSAMYPSSGYITGHVYRSAYSWYVIYSGSRSLTSFPAGNVSIGPVTSIQKFDGYTMVGTASAVLTSVGFSLDNADLGNNYSGTVTTFPGVPVTINVTTSSAVQLVVAGVTRVSGTINRPTTHAVIPSPTGIFISVVGSAATSITPSPVNFSDATTLAACTGFGALSVLYTSVHPVVNQAGSSNCTMFVNAPTYGFKTSITYNFSVPRE